MVPVAVPSRCFDTFADRCNYQVAAAEMPMASYKNVLESKDDSTLPGVRC